MPSYINGGSIKGKVKLNSDVYIDLIKLVPSRHGLRQDIPRGMLMSPPGGSWGCGAARVRMEKEKRAKMVLINMLVVAADQTGSETGERRVGGCPTYTPDTSSPGSGQCHQEG